MRNEEKREKWYRLMQDYERSGKSVHEWCAETGCTYHMFKYWRYRVRIQETYPKAVAGLPTGWVQATLPANPQSGCISIRIGACEIAVGNGFDGPLLRDVVEALS